jgi:hypothetical protein
MKRSILFLSILFLSISLFAQIPVTPVTSEVEVFSIASITDAVKIFVSYINWVYVLVFMLATWLINDTADASNVSWLNWFSKVPKAVRSVIIGLLLIVQFMYVFKFTGRLEIFKMILSLLLGMVIFKFGINKIFAWLSARLGFKFE